jgi:putative peptidoglycan lipid II flippase
VLLLGGLQRRRFEREAAARGTALDPAPGMLDASIRLAFAAAIAIGAGLGFRMVLISFWPGTDLAIILMRATMLCAFGVAAYLAAARVFGVRELSEIEGHLLRRIRSRSRA